MKTTQTAMISTDNGLSHVTVDSLTDAQVQHAVSLTEQSDSECREDAHSTMTSTNTERDYLAAFCLNHEQADLGVFTIDIGNPSEVA